MKKIWLLFIVVLTILVFSGCENSNYAPVVNFGVNAQNNAYEWRGLSANISGEDEYFLYSKKAVIDSSGHVDKKPYNGINSNSYANSYIRLYLTDVLYNQLFSDAEKALLKARPILKDGDIPDLISLPQPSELS